MLIVTQRCYDEMDESQRLRWIEKFGLTTFERLEEAEDHDQYLQEEEANSPKDILENAQIWAHHKGVQ